MAKLDDAEDLPEEEWPPTLLIETKIARKMFRDMRLEGFEIGAQFVGIKKNGDRWVHLMQDLMIDFAGKDLVAAVMVDFISGGCEEAMFMAEAWMSDDSAGYAWRMANPDKPMKEYEHSIEILMITHYSISGDVMASAKIENGNLGKFRVKKVTSSSGRFSNLFLRAQEKNAKRN